MVDPGGRSGPGGADPRRAPHAGMIIARTGGEANFKITLAWEREGS